jgi:hypothetical protein
MRRALVITALVILITAVAIEFTAMTIWDGSFDLTVKVTSSDGPIEAVWCQAENRESAEFALKDLKLEPSRWSAAADPFRGQPLTVPVPISGRDSPLGRELGRTQFRDLVVIAQVRDGRRLGKLVEIPDCRVSREVSVQFP